MDCFLFDRLRPEERTEAEGYFDKPQEFSKGDDIYKVGFIGILLSGSAFVRRKNKAGNEITVRNMTQHEIFGSVSVFGNWQTGLSSIIASTHCTVSYICEANFKRLLSHFPEISFNYITFLSDRLRFLNSKLDIFLVQNTESRLYEFLCSHADDKGCVRLDLSMSELAKRLKIGRSSLYRDIDALIDSGLITRRNKLLIVTDIMK